MNFDWTIIAQSWPLFLHGTLITICVSVASALLGFLVAIPICLCRMSRIFPIRMIAFSYIEVLRNVPFIIILFLTYYGIPFFGIRLPALFAGTLSLALFASAYYTEVMRSAVLSVPSGQMESARAIGMSHFQALFEIVAPQTIRFMVPPTMNTTTSLIKESSVLSTITISELTYQGLVVQSRFFAPMESFAAVALIYWALTAAISRLFGFYESRVGAVQISDINRSQIAAKYLALDYRPRT